MAGYEFDEDSSRYRCCCNCFHLRTGALVIGTVELCMIITQLISAVVIKDHNSQATVKVNGTNFQVYYDPSANMVITFAWGLIHIGAIGLMFYGLTHVKPRFLIPHLSIQVFSIIMAGILSLTLFILMGVGKIPSSVWSGVTVVYLLIAGLYIWFFSVVLRCYRYLKDRYNSKYFVTVKTPLHNDFHP